MDDAVLLLIRHAESTWNAAGRWQGRGDPPLSSLGRRQARVLARDLAGQAIDALVTSDLRRASETAGILGAEGGLEPVAVRGLRELDVGDWTGLSRAEIAARAGPVLERLDAGDDDVRPGGGETLRELRARARRALAELSRAHPGRRVAVVTHAGVIRALVPGAAPDNAEWLALPARAVLGGGGSGRL